MKKRLHCCALPLVLCAVLVSLSAGPRQILAVGPPDGGEAVLPSPGREETARMVALTFDDGPDPVYTDEILDVLERCGARATFFEVGEKLRDVPGALEREEALGCEVGSHSYSHQKFSKIGGGEALADMEASDAAFTEVLGRVPELLRPRRLAVPGCRGDRLLPPGAGAGRAGRPAPQPLREHGGGGGGPGALAPGAGL